jgi:hypothetical protein
MLFIHPMWDNECQRIGMQIGMGVASEIMVQTSWAMVSKRGFEYDYENREASWVENGKLVYFRYDHNCSNPNDEAYDAGRKKK